MKRLLRPEEWVPVGVKELEPVALEVVGSRSHYSVIAGPGAGKTELLAQRANYLLRTGTCPAPRRILAISFKRDAARNLKERVSQRCEPEEAFRFDSFTFDAFAKHLLDRFWQALPLQWRPTPDYEIVSLKYRDYWDFLDRLAVRGGPSLRTALVAISDRFEKDFVLGTKLPFDAAMNSGPAWRAADQWWDECLHKGRRSRLTFPMIGRLVELLVGTNDQIQTAMQLTYSHVFLDEFQDTTHVQYDLVRTIFAESGSVLTAVGDNKQQIMRWAMALPDPFGKLEQDYGAKRALPIRNYRSSPELVRIQHQIALVIDPGSKHAESMTKDQVATDACAIWDFKNRTAEADRIGQLIAGEVASGQLTNRDFVILVRQKPQDYAPALIQSLRELGVKARNEAELQDLLTEPLTQVLIRFLRLGASHRAGAFWTACFDVLSHLRAVDSNDEVKGDQLSKELAEFRTTLSKQMHGLPRTSIVALQQSLSSILSSVVSFLDPAELKHFFPEYRQGDWFEKVLEQNIVHLSRSLRAAADWPSALDDVEGLDAVPIMTIHKSKGLEYHTVIFVGLDDSAWWGFKGQPAEEISAFFVAFSRAKQRVIFTYCQARGRRTDIASLYDVLRDAGVETVAFEDADEDDLPF